MNSGKAVAGILAGVAVGAIMGILLAPDRGSETRKRFTKKGLNSVEDLNGKFEELLKAVGDQLEGAKKQAADLAQKGKGKAADTGKAATSQK